MPPPSVGAAREIDAPEPAGWALVGPSGRGAAR